MVKATPKHFWYLGMGLYLLCLLLPAYETFTGSRQGTVHSGAEALFTGIGGLLGGNFAWLANPMLWYAWRQYRKKAFRRALLWSLAALAVALSFLVSDKVNFMGFGSATFKVGAGYFTWLLSIACTLAAAVLGHVGRAKQGVNAPTATPTPPAQSDPGP